MNWITPTKRVSGDWSKMLVRPHFILWGRIPEGNNKIADFAITQRKDNTFLYKFKVNNVVWEDTLSIYGEVPVKARVVLEKLERLWPCSFLAKEYRNAPHFRKQADDLQNDR